MEARHLLEDDPNPQPSAETLVMVEALVCDRRRAPDKRFKGSIMKRKTVSIVLPVGVNVEVVQGDDDGTRFLGEIRHITIRFDVPMDEAAETRKQLRNLARNLFRRK